MTFSLILWGIWCFLKNLKAGRPLELKAALFKELSLSMLLENCSVYPQQTVINESKTLPSEWTAVECECFKISQSLSVRICHLCGMKSRLPDSEWDIADSTFLLSLSLSLSPSYPSSRCRYWGGHVHWPRPGWRHGDPQQRDHHALRCRARQRNMHRQREHAHRWGPTAEAAQ